MFRLRDKLQKGRGKGRKARKRKGKGASLPAKRAIMVGSSSGKWSNFDLPKLMPEEYKHFLRCLHHGCFLLIHVNKLLFTAQPIRILRTPVSAEMNKRGFL